MADYNGEKPPPYTGPNMQQQGSTNPKHAGYDQYQQQPANMGQPAQPQIASPNPMYNAGYNQPGTGYIHTEQVHPQLAPYNYPPMVQQPSTTNVNVTQVNTGGPSVLMVPTISDQTFMAVFVCLCCFFPTGIAAIYYASKAQSDFSAGDFIEAKKSNDIARRMIILSFILPWVIGGILTAILVTTASTYYY